MAGQMWDGAHVIVPRLQINPPSQCLHTVQPDYARAYHILEFSLYIFIYLHKCFIPTHHEGFIWLSLIRLLLGESLSEALGHPSPKCSD